jgi:regulator of nonsense transcripts 1
MLDIQYRMHPRISHFPSLEFYNSSIQDGTMDKDGNVVVGLEPPMSLTHLLQEGDIGEGRQRSRPSVIFLDHFGYETMSGRSRVNHHEAQIVVSLVEDLLLQNPVRRLFLPEGSGSFMFFFFFCGSKSEDKILG